MTHGAEEEDEADLLPENPDPEGVARIARKNRDKFAIKKSYSIEVRTSKASTRSI